MFVVSSEASHLQNDNTYAIKVYQSREEGNGLSVAGPTVAQLEVFFSSDYLWVVRPFFVSS